MKTRDLVELLAEHADALNQGTDNTAALLARHTREAADLAPLLRLARSLKAVLEPVKPPAAFTARLHQDLMQGSLPTVSLPVTRNRAVWVGAAAVGSLLPLAGLLIWFLRRGRPGPIAPAI